MGWYGRIVLALAMAGLGMLSLVSGDFAFSWQPVPVWVPWRSELARVCGAFLFALGCGLLLRRIAARCAIGLAILWLLSADLLHFTRAIAQPIDIGRWLGAAENLLLVSGACAIFYTLRPGATILGLDSARSFAILRVVVGWSCIVCGMSHFVYASFTLTMIPTWIPLRGAFVWITGAAHIAAGVALITGVLPRLAMICEAAMITSFVLLVHITRVAAAPHTRLAWTEIFMASGLAGALWCFAAFVRPLPIAHEIPAPVPVTAEQS